MTDHLTISQVAMVAAEELASEFPRFPTVPNGESTYATYPCHKQWVVDLHGMTDDEVRASAKILCQLLKENKVIQFYHLALPKGLKAACARQSLDGVSVRAIAYDEEISNGRLGRLDVLAD